MLLRRPRSSISAVSNGGSGKSMNEKQGIKKIKYKTGSDVCSFSKTLSGLKKTKF